MNPVERRRNTRGESYWFVQNAIKLLETIYKMPSRVITLEHLNLKAKSFKMDKTDVEDSLELLGSQDLVAHSGNVWYTTTIGSLLIRKYK